MNFEDEATIRSKAKNELDNMSPPYEAYQNDSEWTTKEMTFLTEILGSFSKYAIQLSPYVMPDKLEVVVKYLEACLKRSYNWEVIEGKYWAKLSLCEINKMLYEILESFNVVVDWSKPRVDHPYNPDDPDTYCIDLYSLFFSTCLDLKVQRFYEDNLSPAT